MSDKVWTVASVKEELPSVPLRFNGELYQAQSAGRKMYWAKLYIKVGETWIGWEFAWETIVNILNNKTEAIV